MDYKLPSLYEPFTQISQIILESLIGLAQADEIGGVPFVSPVMMQAIWRTYFILFGESIGNFARLGREGIKINNNLEIDLRWKQSSISIHQAGAIFRVATGKQLLKLVIVIFLFAILLNVFLKTKSTYKKIREKERSELVIKVEMKNLNTVSRFGTVKENELQLYLIENLKRITLFVIIVVALTLLKRAATYLQFQVSIIVDMYFNFINFIIFAIEIYNFKRYRKQIKKEDKLKQAVEYDFQGDFFEIAVKLSMKAGFLGGLVVLGRVVVLTHVWLEIGVNPPSSDVHFIYYSVYYCFRGYHISQFLILAVIQSIIF
ncbi:unnamed protein product [Paramecium sonneborni]|uniref:Uncharacterized protein n=1 Tax=Paramecium sonneborni TaxID=65129 RepID=A0A8S1R543_9CILI|nr:unnamed protein product [Paramecium sonneborni]